jgi:transcriptional regulator with XRE-family HTH domain
MPKVKEDPATTPGQRLRDLRLAKGWTQGRLAARARVAPNTIGHAERGERAPSLLVRERIARALGVSRFEIWPSDDDAVRSWPGFRGEQAS